MRVDYEQLFRDAGDAIVVADSTGIIVEVNSATEDMLGWPNAYLRGRSLTTIMPERYRAAHERGLARYLATRVPTLIGRTIEVEALRRDGQEVRVELSLSVLHGGPQLLFAAVIRDLTRATRLEEAVNEAREHVRKLGEEVRLRDEFLSTASHELRTPLSTLKMQVRLLERTNGASEGFVRLRRQADRLDRLIGRMLDASRIADGRLEISSAPLDLVELARDTIADLSVVSPAHPIAIRAPVGPVEIVADADRMSQVLFNLIDNAIKYSPDPGPIHVDVWKDDRRAYCRVTDSGLGVPTALQPHLFSRFSRETSERVRSIAGLGVGLYISRAIVEAHGGSIRVESEQGKGSSFTFEVPLGPPSVDEPKPRTPTVLLVDDDPDLLDVLRQTLEGASIRAEIAQNGVEALSAIRRLRPSVVLLDLMMPIMNGWECYRRIRADEKTRDLPIIVFSGDHTVAEKAAALGATGSLGKPFDVDALLTLVRRYLPEAPPRAPNMSKPE